MASRDRQAITPRHMGSPDKRQSKPWWLHFLAIATGVLACLCADRFGPGWSGSIAAAAAALLFPAIIYYRKTEKRERFWVTVTLLAIIQVPLVIAVRPVVERFGLFLTLAFGALDCLLVAFAITWVCSGGILG